MTDLRVWQCSSRCVNGMHAEHEHNRPPTDDELIGELVKRGGDEVFWRIRAVWWSDDPPVILEHGNLIEIDHGVGQVLLEWREPSS